MDLNHREIAILIWLGIGVFLGLLDPGIRSPARELLRAASQPKLLIIFGVLYAYVAGVIWVLSALSSPRCRRTDGNYFTSVLPASLLAADGMALAYIAVTMSGMAGARPEDTGLASGLVNTTYQIGSSIGLVVMVALAASTDEPEMPAGVLNSFHAAFAAPHGSLAVPRLMQLLRCAVRHVAEGCQPTGTWQRGRPLDPHCLAATPIDEAELGRYRFAPIAAGQHP